jgi:hypothetical protein
MSIAAVAHSCPEGPHCGGEESGLHGHGSVCCREVGADIPELANMRNRTIPAQEGPVLAVRRAVSPKCFCNRGG